METQALSLSFRYSEHDYVHAMRAHYASRLRLPVDVVVIIGLIVFGIYEVNSGSKAFGITSLAVSILFALMLVSAFFVIPIYAFRSQAKFRDNYSLVFSPEGIHFRTANIDSNLQWSMYDRALIDAKSLILYYGKQQFTVIPKRVFGNTEQIEAFETMVRQHVPNVVVRR